jgi:hypothetical protein
LHLEITIRKTKRGDTLPPATMLNKALYTLDFLTYTNQELTTAEKHWDKPSKATFLWKDVLLGTWVGPSPVLMWDPGLACVFPEGADQPVWVLSHFVNPYGSTHPTNEETATDKRGQDRKEVSPEM